MSEKGKSELGGEREWIPCMCGKWFWQGLKLMISTCAIVENHQKEKCRQKHLQYGHAGATDGETTRTVRQKLWRKLLLKREKKHVLLLQNVYFNAGKVSSAASAWDLKEPSSHERTCRLSAEDTVHLFNRRNDSFYWLFRAARCANQPIAMAACYI